MVKYTVEIVETLSKIIEVEAENCEEAINVVHQKYRDEKYVLDADDYVETSINIFM